jgi:hypothetical protein
MMAGHHEAACVRIAGVKALPAKTPITGRDTSRTATGIDGLPPKATAMAVNVTAPSIQGSGRLKPQKAAPPTPPTDRAFRALNA